MSVMKRNGALVREKYMEYLGSTLASSLSIYLATIVDGILVGQLMGATPLTAINLTMPVVYIKNIIFMLFISGGCILVSQYLGERRKSEVDKVFTLSVFGCMAGYVLLLLIGSALSPSLSAVFSLNGAGREYVQAYLLPLLAAGPVQAVTNGCAFFLRLDGRHKLSATIPIVANVINLCCDYIFIRFFGWGIAGAGWATVTGYVCGAFLLIPYFRDRTRNLHFVPIEAADLTLLTGCFREGLPMACIQGCNVLRNYTMNHIVLSGFGDMGSQVIAVCNNALFYAMMFADGATAAMASVCGTLFGEKDFKGVKSVLQRALLVAGGFCVGVFLLLELFPVEFGLFYNVSHPDAQAMLSWCMRIFALYIPFLAPLYVVRSFYQATKHTNAATAISILEGAAVTVPVLFALSFLNRDLIWLGNCLGAVISLAVVLGFMQKKARGEGMDSFLMISRDSSGRSHEFSVSASEESAEMASGETIAFIRECGVSKRIANALGVSSEELCVNISRYAKVPAKEQIDVFIRIMEDRVLLKVRDSGIPFNPTEFVGDTGERITGLALIRAMGCEISYDRIIGFNTTIITAFPDGRPLKAND